MQLTFKIQIIKGDSQVSSAKPAKPVYMVAAGSKAKAIRALKQHNLNFSFKRAGRYWKFILTERPTDRLNRWLFSLSGCSL